MISFIQISKQTGNSKMRHLTLFNSLTDLRDFFFVSYVKWWGRPGAMLSTGGPRLTLDLHYYDAT